MEVWEASVRATHNFLNEADILIYKGLIPNYLDSVNLYAKRNKSGNIIGFMGIADGNIEMLFIHPDARGKGIGKEFIEYALTELEANKVDVNEQNEQAVGFYLKMGFKVNSRSETDPQGKPYPILHLVID